MRVRSCFKGEIAASLSERSGNAHPACDFDDFWMAESPNPADDVTTAAGSDPQDFRCRGSQLVAGVCENPCPLAVVEKSSSLDQTPSVTSVSAGRATGPTRQQTREGSTSEFDLIVSVTQLSCSKRRRLSAACLHTAMRFHLGSIPGQVSQSFRHQFLP